MSRSYNLLCRPWIPVVWRDSALEPKEPKVGVREALERAREIRCISHTSPFIEFGLYRLLITIVLDAYICVGKRPTVGRMCQMLNEGSFDTAVICCYLETFKEAFELWGDGERFLQGSITGETDPVAKAIAPIPSGTKIAFWHHSLAEDTSLSEEEAAQELCAVSPFCFDYAPSDICTIAGDPPLYVLVQGESLFESITLNLPRPSGRVSLADERTRGPIWRTRVDDSERLPPAPTICEGWTWPVRKIRLAVATDEGRISGATNAAGAGKTDARRRIRSWRDPNAGTVTSSAGLSHIRGRDGLLVTRDLLPLFLVASEGDPIHGERRRSRPEVVSNALRAMSSWWFRLSVYGFIDKGGKNNKVFRSWFHTRLSFPAEIARDERLSHEALNSFKSAQKVADALRVALRMLRPTMAAVPREKATLRVTQRAEADLLAGFWWHLESALAHDFLDTLAAGGTDAKKQLNDSLRRQARDALAAATGPHRRNAHGLFRVANASNFLEGRLARLLPK